MKFTHRSDWSRSKICLSLKTRSVTSTLCYHVYVHNADGGISYRPHKREQCRSISRALGTALYQAIIPGGDPLKESTVEWSDAIEGRYPGMESTGWMYRDCNAAPRWKCSCLASDGIWGKVSLQHTYRLHGGKSAQSATLV